MCLVFGAKGGNNSYHFKLPITNKAYTLLNSPDALGLVLSAVYELFIDSS